MQLGIIGLGKMGANMARRLVQNGHTVVGFDVNREAVDDVTDEQIQGAYTLEELVGKLDAPRHIWLMVPAGDIVDNTIAKLRPLLAQDDTLIDGGNSNYKDTVRRARDLEGSGLHYMDVGTSGGVWGLQEGYSMMIGGTTDAVEAMRPIFETLAPAADKGWGHVGPSGSGHFVKMIHNGIEYGLMEAYAEGFAILHAKEEFGLDMEQISEIWRHGSVIRSWLLDLAAAAFQQHDDALSGIAPFVPDSGEGRWTVAEAIDLNVPAPVITLALTERLASRTNASFTYKMLAALRNQFGGHAMKATEERKEDPAF